MLTGLSLRNFKAWKELNQIRLAPITGLFGTNSSGKSSLIQSLLLLKQTAESDDRKQVLDFGDDKSRANLGGFKDIIFGHDEKKTLGISLAWEHIKSLSLPDFYKPYKMSVCEKLRFDVDIDQPNGKPSVVELCYNLQNRSSIGLKRKDKYPTSKADKNGKGEQGYELFSQGELPYPFKRNQGRVWPLPAPIKFYGFPDEAQTYYQNADFVSDLQLELTQMLGRIFYLGPLREYPRRYYTAKGATPGDMGTKGEFVIDAILAARHWGQSISPGFKKKKKSLEEMLAFWLKKMGLIHSFRVESIKPDSNLYEVRVKRGPQSSEVLMTDVGFGVSQILPVLVMCYYVPEYSTILFEQPEIHLHPSVQMALADLFIEVSKTRHVQIILESHSEHLLNRLQRRLAEEVIGPDEVALYFCESKEKGSELRPLDLDMFGNIANWPNDFFGDQFGEVAARQEAQLNRTKKG